jgi:hypothetical protein
MGGMLEWLQGRRDGYETTRNISGSAAFCQPSVAFPPTSDCQLDELACNDLFSLRSMLEISLDAGYADDITVTLEACAEDVAARIADCQGGGGSPGF